MTNSTTPITDALDDENMDVRVLLESHRKLEADRAALIAALEAMADCFITRIAPYAFTASEAIVYETARATLARVQS